MRDGEEEREIEREIDREMLEGKIKSTRVEMDTSRNITQRFHFHKFRLLIISETYRLTNTLIFNKNKIEVFFFQFLLPFMPHPDL